MDPVHNYDIGAAELIYASGPQAGTPPDFVREQAVIEDLAIIERRAGLYLLRALTDQPVEVSGELVSEKILQWGDSVVVGSVRLEFREHESSSVRAESDHARRVFRQVLLALACVIALLIALNSVIGSGGPGPEQPEFVGAPGTSSAAESRSAVSDAEKIAASRLAFAAAERFEAEADSVESYLFQAVRLFQGIVRELEGIEPTPSIAISAQQRFEAARDKLRTKLEFLRNNAFVAHSVSEDDDLRSILEEVMATIPDASNEEYWQWARDKIIQMDAE